MNFSTRLSASQVLTVSLPWQGDTQSRVCRSRDPGWAEGEG